MAELRIIVKSRAMPISTDFLSFCKGVEQFYYVMLLSSGPYSNRGLEPWIAWLHTGFHLATRIAPPVEEPDKVKVESRPGVKGFECSLSGANADVLGRLRQLLQNLDSARKSLAAKDHQTRLAALLSNGPVQEQLIAPLKNRLTASGKVAPEGVNSFIEMIGRGLLAITSDDILSVEIAQL